MLEENYQLVKEKVSEACKKAGRDPSEVTVIAVSKTKPVEMVHELYQAGVRDFGENKVQELTAKYDESPKDIRWHMIGHLQTNKVKYIVDKAALIHSVDSIKLAKQIHKEAQKHQVQVPVLLQVNLAREETKSGFFLEDLIPAVENIQKMNGISVQGIMQIAPYVVDPEQNRSIFAKMKEISLDIDSKKLDNVYMRILSMGMSNDFQIAVEEGATMIRVGTDIFGRRDYTGTHS